MVYLYQKELGGERVSIEVLRPIYLILIPIFMIFIIYLGKSIIEDKKRRRLIIIIRCIIAMLLTLSLVNITVNKITKDTSTIFLLDLSHSNEEFKENGQDFIKNALREMGTSDYAGIVVFGQDSKVEKFVSKSRTINSIESKPIASATNIENAINTGISLFPSDKAKRFVLITDGEENIGKLEKTIPSINEQNIDMKVYKVEKSFKKEVYVDNLKLPDKINIGDEFSIGVGIYSNIQTKTKVYLYEGSVLKAQSEVSITKGMNNFTFKDIQKSGGVKNYKVVIDPAEDTEVKNNEYIGYTNVLTKERLFIAEGKKGQGDNIANILSSLGYSYDRGLGAELPNALKDMLAYKGIISVDVHGEDFPKGFKDSLDSYVKEYGGAFIATGGEDSYALGEYTNTPLEKVLPVNMDMKGKKEVPKMSIALVIDHSGSMGGGNGEVSKLTLAKEAAQKAADTLRENDEIGVIAFDQSYSWIVKGEKGSNKEAVKDKIGQIQVNGGTSIYPALKEAYEYEKKSDAKIKHIILLTDGQDGFRQYDDIIKGLGEDKITLSTVSVGEDADTKLLQSLAESGKGRSYHTDIYTDLPRIFAKEIFMASKAYLNNREFTPKLVNSHEILDGVINDGKVPNLLGYVGTSPKENATVVFNSDEDDPILALWQYGLGRSVAWTSDVTGKWDANYTNWDGYKKLWGNILNWSLDDYTSGESNLNISVQGNEAHIEYKSNSIKDNTKLSGIYTKSDGSEGNFNLDIKAPGVYEKNISLDESSFYSVSVREENDGKITSVKNGVIALQYSLEYKLMGDTGALDSLVEGTNGKFIKLPKEIFNGEIKKVKGGINLSLPLKILALIILMFEIAYRRLDFNITLPQFIKRIHFKKKVKKALPKKERSLVESEIEFTPKVTENSQVPKEKVKKDREKKNEKAKLNTELLLKKKKDRRSE